MFLAAGGRSLLSVLAHLILGRQTLSSGMISSGYFVEKGIVARTEENGEEADTSPGNTGIKLVPFCFWHSRLLSKGQQDFMVFLLLFTISIKLPEKCAGVNKMEWDEIYGQMWLTRTLRLRMMFLMLFCRFNTCRQKM